MREVMRQRPEGAEVLGRYSAHVAARPRPVFHALVGLLDPGPSATSVFLADEGLSLIVAQGGFWYRAEYRVVPDERGSHVDHTLLNVAPRARGLGRALARRTVESAGDDFERLIAIVRADVE